MGASFCFQLIIHRILNKGDIQMSLNLQPIQLNLTKANGLCIYQGSYWALPISISVRNNLADEPVDLTDYTGACVIKRRVSDDVSVAVPTVEISQVVTNNFVVSLSSDLTRNLPINATSFEDTEILYYEVSLISNSTGESSRILYGDAEIVPGVIDSDDMEE